MERIGSLLRTARNQAGLSLRDVEERCALLASQRGVPALKVSAGWLNRVERQSRGLAAVKLISLASVLRLSAEQMLSLCSDEQGAPREMIQITNPNSAVLMKDGSTEQRVKAWLPDSFLTDLPPESTRLLCGTSESHSRPYRRGVIGREDRTMEPMIRAGAVVLIDVQRRVIASHKDWTSEYDRPVYFLYTRSGCHCGFCELDKEGKWLRLSPHSLSPQRDDRRWRYRKEIDVIGTVVAFFTRRDGVEHV
jgi:transcriptional regulator with XRE-family HTH domain